MGSAGKLCHEAGWVAVHPPRFDVRSEPGRIVGDGKATSISSYLPVELSARGCSVIPADALHVPRPLR
jgi:hypothetical protein